MKMKLALFVAAATGLAMAPAAPVQADVGFASVGLAAASSQAPTAESGVDWVVASGTLERSGRPVTGDVVAILWPSQAELAKIGEGEIVPTLSVAAGKSASTGEFSIHLDPANLPDGYRGDQGQIDIQLIAADTQTEMEWSFSARPEVAARRWVSADKSTKSNASPVGAAAIFRMDLKSGQVTDSLADRSSWRDASDRPLTVVAAQESSRAVLASRSSRVESALSAIQGRTDGSQFTSAAPTAICTITAGTIYYNRPEYFLKVYAWSGALGTVSQSYGVDHKLGIGVKSLAGGWSGGGSSTISLNASGSRGAVADATVFNSVNYRDYRNSCSPSLTRKPYGVYALLSNFTYAPHVNYSACTRYTGGTYSKVQGTNVTYSAGVDISGFSVLAQSGHNSESKTSWTVTRATKLCGSSSAGWVSSSQAEAHSG